MHTVCEEAPCTGLCLLCEPHASVDINRQLNKWLHAYNHWTGLLDSGFFSFKAHVWTIAAGYS